MALEFRVRDFLHPMPLAARWWSFRRAEHLTPADLVALQEARLRRVVRQAALHVPYYRDLFKAIGAAPDDIRTLADLARLPLLKKEQVSSEGERLWADDRARWGAQPVTTSGTTGSKLTLLMDRPANALEFNYYLRAWSWAGYRLGMPFGEFSTVYFQKSAERRTLDWQWSVPTRRLLLNSVELSAARVKTQLAELNARGALFLKGLPSVLYHFALFVRELGTKPPPVRAIFSQGESLSATQRRVLVETFGCQVFDSYGHMERTVAISECREGSMHVISDYGILEMEAMPPSHAAALGDGRLARIIGTGLYNMSMPLLRYDTGDYVKLPHDERPCRCGRPFPVVEAVMGRHSTAISTPDGRVITAAFLVFEEVEGVAAGTLRQVGADRVVARVAPSAGWGAAAHAALQSRIEALVGPAMRVAIVLVHDAHALRGPSGKTE